MSMQNHTIFISSESCYIGYVLYTGRWIRLNRTYQSPYLEKLAQQRLVTRLRTIDNISINIIATVCSYQSMPAFHSLLQNINIHLTHQPPVSTLIFSVQDYTKSDDVTYCIHTVYKAHTVNAYSRSCCVEHHYITSPLFKLITQNHLL